MPKMIHVRDLKRGNAFTLGGLHYIVLDVYETVNEEMRKIAFISNQSNPFPNVRCTMTLPKDQLFCLLTD